MNNKRRKINFQHNHACPACGVNMKETTGELTYFVNGEEIKVPGLTHLLCPKCKEVVLRLDESRMLQQKALELYREKYGLLSASEIRSIRLRLNLTQEKFSQLLHLGKNTISRWEAGRNVQTAAMDILLRLIRDVPENIEYLKLIA